MSDELKLTRRGFVKGAGLAAGAAALLEGAGGEQPEGRAKSVGPGAVEITLKVNGVARRLSVEPRATLASALRDQLHLTGTKIGCDRGACGACTVLLGGEPVASCLTFALDAAGKPVTTIEGLAREGQLAPIQAAFVAHDALQCGFCTPGMLMSCQALLQHHPHPTEEQVRAAVAGNTCRCGTYPKVFEAALAAAATGPAGAGPSQGDLPAVSRGAAPDEAALAGKEQAAEVEARTFQVGLPGALASKERKVPRDEPAPWDGRARLSVVGQKVPRLEGPEKVTGRARYSFDVQLPGMLHAAVVRSPHAHARIKSVDVSAAAKMPGVQATYVVERLLGPARPKQEPAGAERYPRIRYEGAPVAAVAALTPAQAEDAARAVRVEYEVLPHVADIDEARKEGAPLVFEGPVEQGGSAGGGGAAKDVPQKGNVRGPVVGGNGADVEKALAGSEVRLAQEYRTEVQTHSAIETHGVVADWRDDGVTLYASTQGIHTVREEIATLFQLPRSKVRVICEFTGGGFGAKFGAGNYGVIALHLSQKARRPVRLFLDRRAEHLAVGNRPSSIQRLRLGAAKDGALQAIALEAFGSAGCAAGAGCAGPVKNLYPAAAVRSEENDVFLHTGPAAAFRAPGHPQGAFALEQALDELAERLGMDPIALRDRNDAHPARREERRLGREKFGWEALRARKDKGALRRGVGFAQGLWYNFDGRPANAEVLIHDDGSIECRSGVADIGGGIRTACAQVVAEVLGVRPRDVTVHIGDTALPEGPPSGGSVTTQLLTPAVRLAAERAKAELFSQGGKGDVRAAAKKLGRTVRGLGSRARDYAGWQDDDRYTATIGGAQFVEVEVDTGTGIVRVARALAVHDCGRPVNRLAIESQINGGIIQGVSYALHERRVIDRGTGRMLNADLEHYRIAGARDVPRIEAVVLDHFRGRSNTDASGIGEPAAVPTCAAIANAVAHALGVRVRSLPLTPARVLEALKGARS
ncbi:MAG TPA: molybdopterin-dependent oxidoreductase [Myxococcales bacterium]|nr:molybdopterin-dependent oxidoreductase [Myxococcales bacterium]